ncbi:ATPase N2B (nucleotide (GTP) binding protein) [Legionella birminghamensis]|uniref:ATPase N2B (Nucleotide (GTP) binding protein) n=1 Tax=Legionella birminghamensis TaxID=28083 RepID=A0A378I6X6_9GAMM|nr:cell division protein ZapE [Legionella birminghamensis]KTC70201.1 ATPase N2B (nucleotide (GTP) binding protein) [Legionella birminghamensis]STX30391.1 ATPase N2B (nucleotide (GTP) binding protein) [Legionella birminghamensis]
MNLLERYDLAIQTGDIEDDPLQRKVLLVLEQLSVKLSAPKKFFSFSRRKAPLSGLYMYGSVGVGKTFLMDMFFENLTIKEKLRFHFHHFMQQVDKRLRALQGVKNPLQRIASDIARTTRVLCFDEFMVDDVAYAMILGELMQALFEQGIVLVATSNCCPDKLYWNGVQRPRFLPAIEAIKAHCQVIALGERRDYRLGRQKHLETYLYPLTPVTKATLENQFIELAGNYHDAGALPIQNRDIPFVMKADGLIWFEFRVICNLPRSQLDYLEIAEQFDTIFVSSIPQFNEKDTIFAILFIHFIDVMYDRGIRLILSAEVPLAELYRAGEMSHPFKRTLSRLEEMQSEDYLRRRTSRSGKPLSSLG